tara:strand:- start:58 stop:711 length:654 start_codon:yes stop_codon:yes gene_type:complete
MMTGKITTMEVDDYCEYGVDRFEWSSIRDELESNGDLFRDDLENPLYSIFIHIEGEEEPIDLDNDYYEFPDGKTDAEFYMIIGEDKKKKKLVKDYKYQLKECMTQNLYSYGLESALRDYDDNYESDNDEDLPRLEGEEKCEYLFDFMLECHLEVLDEEPVLETIKYLRGPNITALRNLQEKITFYDEDELTEGITYDKANWKLDMKLVKRYVSNYLY